LELAEERGDVFLRLGDAGRSRIARVERRDGGDQLCRRRGRMRAQSPDRPLPDEREGALEEARALDFLLVVADADLAGEKLASHGDVVGADLVGGALGAGPS